MTASLHGRDGNGVRWVIAISNRIDSRDPLEDYIGIVTAFKG